jgi:hypothetical protein
MNDFSGKATRSCYGAMHPTEAARSSPARALSHSRTAGCLDAIAGTVHEAAKQQQVRDGSLGDQGETRGGRASEPLLGCRLQAPCVATLQLVAEAVESPEAGAQGEAIATLFGGRGRGPMVASTRARS